MSTHEHWKPVVGYEGLYEVSDLGRVKSLRVDRILSPGHKGGRDRRRRHVNLAKSQGIETITIASLVAAAFIGPKPVGFHVHHKSGDPSDDRPENLEYKPGRDHNRDHGQRQMQGGSALNPGQVAVMRRLARDGMRIGPIARRFGVPYHTAKQAISGKYWKNVAEPPVTRATRGPTQHLAKLTESQVKELRRLRRAGWKLTELADKFGVSFQAVSRMARGDSYKHV